MTVEQSSGTSNILRLLVRIATISARLSGIAVVAIGAGIYSSPAIWAQTSDSQTDQAKGSWTATTASQSNSVNPTRTTQIHSQTGSQTSDKQSVEVRGPDGHFVPYQDVEKDTVQGDENTVRTVTRTFDRDADGVKKLVQVTEEEKHTLSGGDSNLVRATSTPDVNGNLQLLQRQIEQTKKISQNVEETTTTLMLRSANGELTPGAKIQERRERGAHGTLESQRVTLLPDGSGNWQTNEIRRTITKQDGSNQSTEERVAVPDAEGKLGEVSRTVSKTVGKENGSPTGEKRNSIDTYSIEVPGTVGDGGLHLVESATTVQRISSTGQQTTEQRIEQVDPGEPGGALRVTIVSNDVVQPDPSGARGVRTVQARDANGSLGVVSVDITKSDNIHAIQVQIAPSEKQK